MTSASPEPPGTATARQPVHRPSPRALAIGIAVAGVVADQVSKSAALTYLPERTIVPVAAGVLRLGIHRNSGVAFGLGAGHPLVWTAVAIAALAGAAALLPRVSTRGYAIVWGMLAAGAAGNLADRLVRGPSVGAGPVVDWVQVAWYRPYFNLADASLRGAVLVILVLAVRREPSR